MVVIILSCEIAVIHSGLKTYGNASHRSATPPYQSGCKEDLLTMRSHRKQSDRAINIQPFRWFMSGSCLSYQHGASCHTIGMQSSIVR